PARARPSHPPCRPPGKPRGSRRLAARRDGAAAPARPCPDAGDAAEAGPGRLPRAPALLRRDGLGERRLERAVRQAGLDVARSPERAQPGAQLRNGDPGRRLGDRLPGRVPRADADARARPGLTAATALATMLRA